MFERALLMRSPIAVVLMAGVMIGCAHGGSTPPDSIGPPADSQTNNWESVQRLSVGTRVSVARFGGDATDGKVLAVDAEKLVVLSKSGALETPRSAVRRVALIVGMDRSTGAKRGFLIGAGAGALAAGVTVENNRGPWMLLLSTGWGALGAMFGALGSEQQLQVIYDVPHPPQA